MPACASSDCHLYLCIHYHVWFAAHWLVYQYDVLEAYSLLLGQKYEMIGWRAWMKWFITKGLWRTMVWSAGVKFTVKGKMASKKEAPIVTGIDKLLYLMKSKET